MLVRHLDREIERVIMTRALEHLHPVKDVATFCVYFGIVEFNNPTGKIHLTRRR
jgi:hypothetical protein